MTFTESFRLKPLAPFSLDLSAQVFSNQDKQVRAYLNGEFNQVFQFGEYLAFTKITSMGTVEQPDLLVELKSNKPITPKIKQSARQVITYVFSLNFDLLSFYKEIENDKAMHKITQQLYGFKFPTTPTVFEGLVDAIVEQQISIKVARTIEERIAKQFGQHLKLADETYYAFPTPQIIKEASISDIQSCGLSQRKAEYIYNAAQLIADCTLDLDQLKKNPVSENIIATLDEIKGIGIWTAELTMLRGMQRFDTLPADDFGIRRVISTYYCRGKPIKQAEAREIAKAWGKWKGLAAFYLILAEAKGIVL
jgi:DNA-3-methyladenine glycosylase II